jgi:hypothetical protein
MSGELICTRFGPMISPDRWYVRVRVFWPDTSNRPFSITAMMVTLVGPGMLDGALYVNEQEPYMPVIASSGAQDPRLADILTLIRSSGSPLWSVHVTDIPIEVPAAITSENVLTWTVGPV